MNASPKKHACKCLFLWRRIRAYAAFDALKQDRMFFFSRLLASCLAFAARPHPSKTTHQVQICIHRINRITRQQIVARRVKTHPGGKVKCTSQEVEVLTGVVTGEKYSTHGTENQRKRLRELAQKLIEQEQ